METTAQRTGDPIGRPDQKIKRPEKPEPTRINKIMKLVTIAILIKIAYEQLKNKNYVQTKQN